MNGDAISILLVGETSKHCFIIGIYSYTKRACANNEFSSRKQLTLTVIWQTEDQGKINYFTLGF